MRNYRAISELKLRKHGYDKTIELMEDCEQRHRILDADYGCNNCPRVLQCDKEFVCQVDTRKGYSWRLRTNHSVQANAKGSGEPDKTGNHIPKLSIPGFKDEILRY